MKYWKKYALGVDIGGTSIKFGVFDKDGEAFWKMAIPTNASDNGVYILKDIAFSIQEYLNKTNLSTDNVLGIGAAIRGAVNTEGVVESAVNLFWKEHFFVKWELEDLTSIPVYALNDANAAALR